MPTSEQRRWAQGRAPDRQEDYLLRQTDAWFRALFPHLHCDPYDLLKAIKNLYCVPVRSYHNFGHVLSMLRYAWVFDWDLEPYEALAILFHDIVYRVGAHPGYNEVDSSGVMVALLGQYAVETGSGSAFEKARQAILDTAYFLNPDRAAKTSHRVMDLDLATLATPHQDEWTYSRLAIAQELPGWTPSADRKFFKTLMERNRIFFLAGDEHEAQARKNIEAYFVRLDEMEEKFDGLNTAR